MKKFFSLSAFILRIIFFFLIIWYFVYFFLGERISIRFSDPNFRNVFTQIIVFAAAVAIYGLLVLSIRSTRKKWINFLLFFAGLTGCWLPLLVYHGYLQYRCGFWNQTEKSENILYTNSENSDESVKLVQKECKANGELNSDTVYVKKLNNYFEVIHQVKIEKSVNGRWQAH